jgi:hypothetical protein
MEEKQEPKDFVVPPSTACAVLQVESNVNGGHVKGNNSIMVNDDAFGTSNQLPREVSMAPYNDREHESGFGDPVKLRLDIKGSCQTKAEHNGS